MTNQESPFADRSMIKQRDRFFGRTAEKFAIFNALAAPKPQCVSIIGERRIGRSSLLWHIKQVYREMLPNAQRYHFAYLDLARDACTTPDQFYAEVAQAFFKQRHNHLTPHQFDDFMTEQRTADQKLILLLDEFNILQRRKDQFNDDFYDGLRARANAGELTYVLASHLPLAQIAVENDFTSTFFGIFTSVSLGEFTTEDARASFLRPVPNELSPANFAIVSRWLNKKYHPLKLNIAANLIWQHTGSINYETLHEKYKTEVGFVLGHSTRRRRLWGNIKAYPKKICQAIIACLKQLTIPQIILLVIALTFVGYISWEQLMELLDKIVK